jgi:hypothetical protein
VSKWDNMSISVLVTSTIHILFGVLIKYKTDIIKTEIILFSNTDIPEFNFTFNRRTILITNSHKHLGVSFSSDAKWNIHVENILLSIYKHLNVLRKLKYKHPHFEEMDLSYSIDV